MDAQIRKTRLLAVAASTLALGLSALPASANPVAYTYDSLGDSFAAGSGVDPSQAHPQLLDGRMRISLDDAAAVPGATVGTMLAGQLGALDAETDLVTISVGGNDVGWSQVVTACLLNVEAVCQNAATQSGAAITALLPGLLNAAYTQVIAAAPGAHVVVTGYPRLFSPEYGPYVGTLTVDLGNGPMLVPFEATVAEQLLMNRAADLLNATIRQVAQVHGFHFVDVTERFIGHGVNAPAAWVFGVGDPVPFHPTVDGQHAYGVALRSALEQPMLR